MYLLKYYFMSKSLPKTLPKEWDHLLTQEMYSDDRAINLGSVRYVLIKKSIFISATITLISVDGFAYINEAAKSLSSYYLIHGVVFLMAITIAFTMLDLPFRMRAATKYKADDETIFSVFSERMKIIIRDTLLWLIVFTVGLLILHYFTHVTFALTSAFILLIGPPVIASYFGVAAKDANLKPNDNPRLNEALAAQVQKINFQQNVSIMVATDDRDIGHAVMSDHCGEYKIILSRFFVGKYSTEDIINVMAHELAHAYYNHSEKQRKFTIVTWLCYLLVLFIVFQNPNWAYMLGFKQVSLHASMIIFWLIIMPLTIFDTMLENWYKQRQEIQADKLAFKIVEEPFFMISTLKRVGCPSCELHLSHPLVSLMEDTHPTTQKRVKLLEEALYST
jgi:STE24 endopeptidase